VKQMKILYQGGFSREELLLYRPLIYRNVLDSVQAIIVAIRKFGFEWIIPENRVSDSLALYPLKGVHHD
jgi:guanine nucleotide-binding protein G(i) subunit alpha